MIDEIKNEIKEKLFTDELGMRFEANKIHIDKLFEILDKYNSQDKEDIKWLINTLKTITENLNNIANIENITDYEFTSNDIFSQIKEIEQKHNIGGE